MARKATVGPALRVLSYNVHGLGDDQDALAAVVRTLAPDVVLLQEAPRRFRWRTRCADMAHAFGLLYGAGGLPSLGNVVLTSHRVRVHDACYLRYPLTPGRHMRGAAFATCSVEGVPFVAAVSHLATDAAERPAQARLLKAAMADPAAPIVFAGDLNDDPGSVAWTALADGLTVAGDGHGRPTFPAGDPKRRLDAIMVDPRIRIRHFETVDSENVRRASDHLPIVCDMSLPVLT
jgi:endonuclease/exonuclease/phosphatase family metal-dependent hydrolase